MAGIMFDSDEPSVLLDYSLRHCRVATYADLVTRELARELAGRLVVIDRGAGDPHSLAHVADVEPGCLTADEAAQRLRQWESEGRRWRTVYHDRGEWQAVTDACRGLHYWSWVATLDGTCMPDGRRTAAVQILKAAQVGLHADLSVVWHDRWCPLPAGSPPPQIAHARALAGQAADAVSAVVTAVQAL